jgi:hypothetical protein
MAINISSGVFESALLVVRGIRESSRGNSRKACWIKTQSAKLRRGACLAAIRGQGERRDKDGSGPTSNHKTSSGLPDAVNRRLNRRRDEEGPFRVHTAQYLCRELGVNLFTYSSSHVTIGGSTPKRRKRTLSFGHFLLKTNHFRSPSLAAAPRLRIKAVTALRTVRARWVISYRRPSLFMTGILSPL